MTRVSDTFYDELIDLSNEKLTSGYWKTVDDIDNFFQFSQKPHFEFENGKIVRVAFDGELSSFLHTSPRKFYTSKIIFMETCKTMADYLRQYNLNDVILLEECVRTYAKGFFDSWGVNIHLKMSLPGVAQGKFAKMKY